MRTASRVLAGAVLIAAWTATGATAQAAAPQLSVAPLAGPPGATVTVIGTGFCPAPCTAVDLSFGGAIVRTRIPVGAGGRFTATFTVPATALGGVNNVFAEQRDTTQSDRQASTPFRVTPSTPVSGSPQPTLPSPQQTASPRNTHARTTLAPGSSPHHSTATTTSPRTTSPRTTSPRTTTHAAGAAPSTPPTYLAATPAAAHREDDGFSAWWWIPIGLAIIGAAIGVIAWRRRATTA